MGVAFFSLEMSKEQLVLRMLCSEARVDSARARQGFLGERDFPKLAQAAARLSDSNIYIDDSSDTTAITLKAKCRRLKRERAKNLGLIIVDYLQLMRVARPGESREKEIAEISRSLKALAKELKVPVIALSQLNRQVESRENRRPMLADLRESGAIEQDADVIAFIYREEMYKGKESKEPGRGRDNRRQAAQRPHRHREVDLRQQLHPLRELHAGNRSVRRYRRLERIESVRRPPVPAWSSDATT